jgi:hypothetical protein
MERPYANIDINHRHMYDDDGETTFHKTEGLHQVYDYPLAQSQSIESDCDDVDKIPLTTKEPGQSNLLFSKKLTSSAAVPFGSFRKSMSQKRQPTNSAAPSATKSGFQHELQQAYKRRQRKQKHLTDGEEKKDDSPSFHLQEREPECFPPRPPPGFAAITFIGTTNRRQQGEEVDYDANAETLAQKLHIEKLKNLALKDRLDEIESKLRTIKQSQSKDLLDDYTRQVRRLQQEVSYYQNLAHEERQMREILEDKFCSLEHEHSKQKDRMKLLVFKEIPFSSPKFKAIGSVDHTIVETPTSVANYDIEEILGKGQYGAVRKAVRRATATCRSGDFAVKIIGKEGKSLSRYKDLESLAVEARILAGNYHPNIVHLEEVIHATENIYIITELAVTDLFTYRRDVGLSEQCVKQAVLGIVLPLIHLHQNGICHLDLKPENVLLTSTADGVSYENVRLADFGLAKMAPRSSESRDVTVKHVFCGTPGFFAPEMMGDTWFIGQRADIWSLGCLLLELTFSFSVDWANAYDQAEYNPEACRRGLEACVEQLTTVYGDRHGKVVDFLRCCLAIEPAERITAAHALRHSWLVEVVPPELLEQF